MIATEVGNSRFIEEQRIQLTEIERIKICSKIGLCKRKILLQRIIRSLRRYI